MSGPMLPRIVGIAALALTDVVPFTSEQRLVLIAAWVVLFLVPAFGVRAHALRHKRPWGRWFVLTVLTGPLGVIEYWEDKAVTERRAKRAAAKRAREESATPPREGE